MKPFITENKNIIIQVVDILYNLYEGNVQVYYDNAIVI